MVDHPRQPTPRPAPRQDARDDDDGPAGAHADRVAKALARAGVASRRDVERYIAEGRVALNGQVLTSPAVKVGPGDILTVDGQVVSAAEATRVWRYHKPTGLVTTHKDPHDRPTVFKHLPAELPRVISVGRLDLNSEGLLLLTNDGELARALELPTSGWVRRYRARAYGHATQARLDTLAKGIMIEGVSYGPIEASLDKVKRSAEGEKAAANLWITVALTEGKNREVRKVLEHLGLKVNRLIRLAYGPFALGTLPVGAVEEVGPRVIREQLADFVAKENLPKGDRRPTTLLGALPGPTRRGPPKPAQARGAAEPDSGRREAPRSAADRSVKAHKPGWAKAKKKVNPHAPPKSKDRRDGRPMGETRGPARPRGVQIDPYPASHKPRQGAKPSGPRTDARPAKFKPRQASGPRIVEREVTPWSQAAPQMARGERRAAKPRPGGPGKPRGARPPKAR